MKVSFDRHFDPTARPPAVPIKGRPPPPHTSIIARQCDKTLALSSTSVIDGEGVMLPFNGRGWLSQVTCCILQAFLS